MSEKELTAKIRDLRELQRMADEANAIAEALKDEIKSAMGETEELIAGDYKVTWKTVVSSRRPAAVVAVWGGHGCTRMGKPESGTETPLRACESGGKGRAAGTVRRIYGSSSGSERRGNGQQIAGGVIAPAIYIHGKGKDNAKL